MQDIIDNNWGYFVVADKRGSVAILNFPNDVSSIPEKHLFFSTEYFECENYIIAEAMA